MFTSFFLMKLDRNTPECFCNINVTRSKKNLAQSLRDYNLKHEITSVTNSHVRGYVYQGLLEVEGVDPNFYSYISTLLLICV